MPYFGDGRDWFLEKRFGLFIHWGIYSIPGWHEQHQWRRAMPRRDYEKLADEFNPVRFDPDQWLDIAEAAGMQYVTFTSKHVDGFCMWHTRQHDYNIAHTPYGKDVLKLLADACHRRGVPLCLYYSLCDMHHPNYPNSGRSYELAKPDRDDDPDFDKYLECVRRQLQELCTEYGEIHGLWWDANVVGFGHPSFNDMIRSLQPNAVLNDRGPDKGDFDTTERDYRPADHESRALSRPMEACQSLGRESWGYRVGEDYYTVKYMIQSIDKMLAKGANYLLNTGPMPDGTIADTDQRMLREIGNWYSRVREAFDHTVPASKLTANPEVLLTQRDNTVYVHLVREPTTTAVVLNPIDKLPATATLLNNGARIDTRIDRLPRFCRDEKEYLRLPCLPVAEFDESVMVIKLEFDETLTNDE